MVHTVAFGVYIWARTVGVTEETGIDALSLAREEYIEQEYFFRVYRERLLENVPSQEILKTVHEEILSTTQLPMAIDFMRTEILHSGRISDAMERLGHYFTAFQTFVIARAEDDVSRFDQVTGLQILEREAKYRSENASMPGLFIYQFECIARNRLGYSEGFAAMARDPRYDEQWQDWIRRLAVLLGAKELAEVIYQSSENFWNRRQPDTNDGATDQSKRVVLFGDQEGRIARANIGRDPLFFFAALQRQLGYPTVPQSRPTESAEQLPGFLEARLLKIEQRLKLIEMEQRGGIDLSRFYREDEGTPRFSDEPGVQ